MDKNNDERFQFRSKIHLFSDRLSVDNVIDLRLVPGLKSNREDGYGDFTSLPQVGKTQHHLKMVINDRMLKLSWLNVIN